jgi:hypothetical protein
VTWWKRDLMMVAREDSQLATGHSDHVRRFP